jgi:hypothetical protein
MGVDFDDITVQENPFGIPAGEYQSRDLAAMMLHYTLKDDGRLVLNHGRWVRVEVSEEHPGGWHRVDVSEEDTQWHGWVTIYGAGTGDWRLKFTDGLLVQVHWEEV